jgi:hypothetical protein
MAAGPEDNEPPKGWKRVYVWSKPVNPPATETTSSATDANPSDGLSHGAGQSTEGSDKLKSKDFHSNFPEQNGSSQASVVDAFKTIKKEDFLTIGQSPCSRQGLLTGIGTGAAIGGLRFVVGGEC